MNPKKEIINWADHIPHPLTICNDEGVILYMNPESIESFKKDGGADLIGSNLIDCHPEPSKSQLREMLNNKTGQTYTIEKRGQKTLIHQFPWFESGDYMGFMELSIKLPVELRNIKRD